MELYAGGSSLRRVYGAMNAMSVDFLTYPTFVHGT